MTEHIVRVVHNRTTQYVVIDKALAESDALSFAARGMMLYLLAKPDDWLVRMADLERASNGLGEQATRTIFTELEAAGYVVRTKTRTNGGLWRYETTVYETPVSVEAVTEPAIDRETVDGSTVYRPTTHGQVPHVLSNHLPSTHPSESLTPKKVSDSETLNAPPKKDRTETQRARDATQTAAREHFERKTGLIMPAGENRKGIATLWWNPIKEICGLVEWDTGRATALIDASISRLEGLTISDPHSIVKTARSLVAEKKRSPGVQRDEYGGVNIPMSRGL
jgi:hypothetical protein